MSESGDLRESHAFKEYNLGPNKKIRPPWVTIIAVGISAAVVSFVLYIFGILTVGNPYAMNMIIGLVGLPAGFIVAFKNKTSDVLVSWRYSSYFKNKTSDVLVSWRYSSYCALIYTAAYFVIGAIFTSISAIGLGGLFGGIVSLLLACLVIAAYSVLVTFSIGALFGTMVNGYLDDKRK